MEACESSTQKARETYSLACVPVCNKQGHSVRHFRSMKERKEMEKHAFE